MKKQNICLVFISCLVIFVCCNMALNLSRQEKFGDVGVNAKDSVDEDEVISDITIEVHAKDGSKMVWKMKK